MTSTAGHISSSARASDLRIALLLTYIMLGWMTVEAIAALLLGWSSQSLLLEAFGIDSVIELFSTDAAEKGITVEIRIGAVAGAPEPS
jgi:hypothetical protein